MNQYLPLYPPEVLSPSRWSHCWFQQPIGSQRSLIVPFWFDSGFWGRRSVFPRIHSCFSCFFGSVSGIGHNSLCRTDTLRFFVLALLSTCSATANPNSLEVYIGLRSSFSLDFCGDEAENVQNFALNQFFRQKRWKFLIISLREGIGGLFDGLHNLQQPFFQILYLVSIDLLLALVQKFLLRHLRLLRRLAVFSSSLGLTFVLDQLLLLNL